MTTAHREHSDDYIWRLCKALGSPVRLEIVRFVRHHPRCICNEILLQLPEECARAQSTLSQHLKILREAEIIEAEYDGTAICYTVNEERLSWLSERLAELRD